jgi:DNA polymerase-1
MRGVTTAPSGTPTRADPAAAAVCVLQSDGVRRGDPVGLVVVPGRAIGLASAAGRHAVVVDDPAALVRAVTRALAPRWVWWSARVTAAPLVAAGLMLPACWDLAAVHRLLTGDTRDDPAQVWAALHGLDPVGAPRAGQLDLLVAGASAAGTHEGDPEDPVRPDGYLRPDWAGGGWARGRPGGERAARWAALALAAHDAQLAALAGQPDHRRRPATPPLPVLTAWSESAAELLCVELGATGLPLDRAVAVRVLTRVIGPRTADPSAEAAARARRDEAVRALVPGAGHVDLRHPGQVRELLARVGIDVPDTRSWRLEPYRGMHPVVDALLTWRRADRIATTYGYPWLDRQVGTGDRLRGAWSGSDGAGGRMTASAGLHNLPAELREAVRAEPGSVLVRADLGQVEPRVLATVSGDPAFTIAAGQDDLYAPVASALRCDRPTAKVAVLAAMYGQTSGTAGEALRGLDRAYPVAMRFLRAADDAGREGRDLRTYGGRLVRMPPLPAGPAGATDPERAQRAAAAGRGRFARNAVVQGPAAELFKMWAVTVRAGLAPLRGQIVLCLHDELLVQVPAEHGEDAARLLRDALTGAAARWAAGSDVRFVVDVAVVERWSDATC